MEEIILEAEKRGECGKSVVSALRRNKFIPAIVYGQGKTSQAIKISQHIFLHFIHEHHLENTLINLKVKGQTKRTVLVKEIQHHPVRDEIVHVDFHEVSLTSRVKVNVAVVAQGEPAGIKQDGGVLTRNLWEVEIECLPTQIPKEIVADVSALKIGDYIHVKDIAMPEGVTVLIDREAIVFSVEPPAKEEEVVAPEAPEGEQPQEPEVIKEKKETEAEGEKEE
ncbi:MAG: 50S ribosomal protein L25 [Candidatus Omnitrophica bacterium]|nr:50S ribosomal protein L25 [Candidatus Omnitrophota bacterium]